MLSGSCPSDRQKLHYEKLCLEVVCCLRKALSQQGDVRKMLYTVKLFNYYYRLFIVTAVFFVVVAGFVQRCSS